MTDFVYPYLKLQEKFSNSINSLYLLPPLFCFSFYSFLQDICYGQLHQVSSKINQFFILLNQSLVLVLNRKFGKH